MKSIIKLNFSLDNNIPQYEIEQGFKVDTFEINIETTGIYQLKDLLNLNDIFKTKLEETHFIFKGMYDPEKDSEETLEFIKTIGKILQGQYNIVDNTSEVYIDAKYEDIISYIERNPILKSKKIVLNGIFELDKNKILELKNIFKNYPNIYINVIGNREIVSIDDCLKTIDIIDKMVEEIKKYNFSPLEQLMYTYDLVRDRVYVNENQEDKPTTSRDLSSVLLGDKIVCVGYANIFDAIVTKLGIKTMTYDIDSKDNRPGHARNIAYIKDEKYEIEGVYYFDTTWDSKRSENDNKFLYGFRYFAKTKNEIEYYQKGKFVDQVLPGYSNNLEFVLEDYIENYKVEEIPSYIIKTINRMSKLIDDGKINIDISKFVVNEIFPKKVPIILDIDKNELLDIVCNYMYLFNNSLRAETLLKVLYNVRKIEYYNNSNKYPFSLEDFFKTLVLSDWKFNPTGKEFLLEMISDHYRVSKEELKNKMDKFNEENDLGRDIENIKLTKTLRKVLDKKRY